MQQLTANDPKRVGVYRLIARLGGGMSRVYLARVPGGPLVALKMMLEQEEDPEGFRERTKREIMAVRRISGKSSLRVFDFDVDGPLPWLAVEYVPGLTLTERVKQQGKLPLRDIRMLASGLAAELTRIHAAGLIHADIQPSNIILGQDGPRIIDFGLAIVSSRYRMDPLDGRWGAAGFMVPEYLDVGLMTPAMDVFALGAVLAYAATSRLSFRGSTVTAVNMAAMRDEPDLKDMPESLRPLIAKCLSKEPGKRPALAEICRQTRIA